MAYETVGIGAKFYYGTAGAAPTSISGMTAVTEAVDFTPPESETDDIDTTHHDITDGYRTFQPGLVDAGESEVKCHYLKTMLSTLAGFVRVEKTFAIAYSDGSVLGWSGYIKGEPTVEVDLEGIMLMSVKTKVSGKPVFTPAA